MERNKNASIGLTYGILIGIIYILLLFARWSLGSNLILFGSIAFFGYFIIIGLLFVEAYQRRKIEHDRVIGLKDLFQTLFISVLIFEAIYSIYNLVHLTLIDPNVVERMKAGVEQMLDKAPEGQVSAQQRIDTLKKFDEMKKATEPLQILKGYLISISISGFFAFLVSLIMKKTNTNNDMPQTP